MFTSSIIKSQPSVSYMQLQLNGLKWTLWLVKVLPKCSQIITWNGMILSYTFWKWIQK